MNQKTRELLSVVSVMNLIITFTNRKLKEVFNILQIEANR